MCHCIALHCIALFNACTVFVFACVQCHYSSVLVCTLCQCASLFSVYSLSVYHCVQFACIPVCHWLNVYSVPLWTVCHCSIVYCVEVYTVCQCASVYIKPVCQCSDWWEHTAVGSSPVREMDGKRRRFGTRKWTEDNSRNRLSLYCHEHPGVKKTVTN